MFFLNIYLDKISKLKPYPTNTFEVYKKFKGIILVIFIIKK